MYKINKYIFFTTFIFYFSCSTKENGRYCNAINSNRIICKEYFNNKVVKIIHYKADSTTKAGIAFTFSKEGDTLSKAYYENDTLSGNYYEWFSKNKPKVYKCFGMNEEILFERKYDSSGKIILEKGEMFYESSIIKKNLIKDSIIEFVNVLLTIPKTSVKFSKYIIEEKNIKDTIYPFESYFGNGEYIHISRFKIKNRGKYFFYNPVEINDSVRRQIISQKEQFGMTL